MRITLLTTSSVQPSWGLRKGAIGPRSSEDSTATLGSPAGSPGARHSVCSRKSRCVVLASTAASSPRKEFVKNHRAHPTHRLILRTGTGMAATLAAAAFCGEFGRDNEPQVLATANLLRAHGTRIRICEKNTGRRRYAFNAFQREFLPAAFRPPPSTICLLYRSPSPRDKRQSRMPSSA